ncbi:UmoD family flagellar biogenesis regulator [Xenorhabdus szentirmaii]|uniref:UmoD n=2 Tax=Xenorhabdus szentirmaii TaxID=290112 RepID=W1IW27_9GAMM|nr:MULTISPECIES: UmoD family flagellar biogenesis regulator [Xenorhabdus]MBD2781190.1 UmoD [Xenorhabdus sp. 38]MBD2791065.1 UmoD [Xenorhabdus sp. CUL]MBD2799809.1 UmoD [Xenorhabdus sp. M]MBD2805115.1 UmoD [Xenorhabdus sp. ZM]MBD2819151.1 UmoD [Xenorhabdus sp. 42]
MEKLKLRQYVIGFIIAIAIIGLIAIFYFKPPRPSIAQVLFSTPIKSVVVVNQSYCHIKMLPLPDKLKNTEEHRLTQYECRTLALLHHLKAKKEYPALTHSVLGDCIPISFEALRIVSYDVNYIIGDRPGKIRVPYNPGETIPLNEKGQLILEQN